MVSMKTADEGEPVFPRVASKRVKRFVFLGTGTSGQVPAIGCLLPGPSSSKNNRSNEACRACQDAIVPGSKNRRGCCSLAVVVGDDESRAKRGNGEGLILIDCGPTFYASAISYFACNGLRRIDALLLTHAHADAILGLDNLRAWTMGGDIQTHVDIYCTQTCFETVEATFPYLVQAGKATGGGAVGALRFHIIDAHKPFTLPLAANTASSSIEVTPLPMFHGPHGGPNGAPFECLGFRIDSLSYLSDTHAVPATTSQLVAGSEVVIIDALNPYRHASHFSLQQALSFILSLPSSLSNHPSSSSEGLPSRALTAGSSPMPKLALLTDLTHNLEHHSTERELRRWNKELQRRCHHQARAVAKPSSAIDARREAGTKAKPKSGEGGGARWWSDLWDEDESERISGRRSLRLVDAFKAGEVSHAQLQNLSLGNGNVEGADAAAKEGQEDAVRIPQFHVAWDGLAIEMEPVAQTNGKSDAVE